MATKTRLGMGTLLVLVLVTAAGLAAMRGLVNVGPQGKQALNDRRELITFFVSWEPSPRSQDIKISIMDEGLSHPWKDFPQKRSPFVRETLVRPATIVKVLAAQEPGAGLLICKIRKGVQVLAQNTNEKTGFSNVICEATT